MADTPQHSLLAEGLSAGQGPDIFELAQQTRQRQSGQRTAVPGTGVGIIDIFTVKGRRAEQAEINARDAKQRAQAEQQIAQQSGQALFGQFGFSEQQQQDPRVQAIEQGLAIPDIRAQTLLQAEDLQAEFGINQPMAEVIMQGFRQQELDRQMSVAIAGEEESIRDDYYTRIAPMVQSLETVELAVSQMKLGDPFSAFNSARLLTQQLDRSMFATQEFTNLVQQAGLEGQVANFFSWVAGGGAFDEFTRAEMVNTMTALASVMEQTVGLMRNDTMNLAANSSLNLNPENVVAMDGFGNRNFKQSIQAAEDEARGIIAKGRSNGTGTETPIVQIENDDGTVTVETNVGTRRLRRVLRSSLPDG